MSTSSAYNIAKSQGCMLYLLLPSGITYVRLLVMGDFVNTFRKELAAWTRIRQPSV
jgi:hypothetical protein